MKLRHNEEVTGSIPVSPTLPDGWFRFWEPAVLLAERLQAMT